MDFKAINSNFKYDNTQVITKSHKAVHSEHSFAYLKILTKEYESLQTRKLEKTPNHIKLLNQRKIYQDYTFKIDFSMKSYRKPIDKKPDVKVSNLKFAVNLGNFYSQKNGQKPISAVVTTNCVDSDKVAIKDRLKKTKDMGNFYSKLNGIQSSIEQILSGTFYEKRNYRKASPIVIKSRSFETFIVYNSDLLDSNASLQNKKCTVDHILVRLNEQSRITPICLRNNYSSISEEIEEYTEHSIPENYKICGTIVSSLFNEITNHLNEDCSVMSEQKKMTPTLQSQREIIGDQNIHITDNPKLEDAAQVEVVVHEAVLSGINPIIKSVKEICSLIKHSVHSFIEDLQMDVKYKLGVDEDYFISKLSESIEKPSGLISPGKFYPMKKSEELQKEMHFVKYANIEAGEESEGEEEVLENAQVYMNFDIYSDNEYIV